MKENKIIKDFVSNGEWKQSSQYFLVFVDRSLFDLDAVEGDSPVYYHKKWNKKVSKIKSVKFYWNKAKPFAKAKYILWLIVNKYCEGKVKRYKLKDLEIVYFKDLKRFAL